MEEVSQPQEKNNLPKGLVEGIIDFLKEVFDLKNHIDKELAREEIKNSISFKGLSAYILMASVVVASVGLNANSVAVVIGAMLISPLMGPIVGLGYSVAVNDDDTLKRSLINFGIMVVIALLTSFLYFSVVPIKTINEQLTGRIEPTSLDVMIAFFGGLAGIAALSSKIKNSNVIAGVAIATALMPPLCTAGYGLAIGSDLVGYKEYTGFEASLNALYLFFINCVFIALSTFIFVKFLRFPLAKFQNAQQTKRTNMLIGVVALITIIPSAFIFWGIISDSIYQTKVSKFLNDEVKVIYKDTFLNIDDPLFVKKSEKDSINKVILSSISERIPNETIENWNTILHNQYGLTDTRLVIHQGAYDADEIEKQGKKFFSSILEQNRFEIQRKDSIINSLNSQINRLNSDSIPFISISKEIKGLYPKINYFGYAVFNYTDFKQRDNIPTFLINWNEETEEEAKKENENKIKQFLQARMNIDSINIIH